jgi:hypothetical protein
VVLQVVELRQTGGQVLETQALAQDLVILVTAAVEVQEELEQILEADLE